MLVAILSDVHGNRHAFEAVLADIGRTEPDELWCLGDLVGYGAEPNECVELARRHCAVVLSGNHDLAVTGGLPLDEFSRGAGIAARWTQTVISDDNRAFLEHLRPEGEEEEVGLYHASPRDPIWEYVLSTVLAEACLDVQPQRVSLIGHSHVACSFVRRPGRAVDGQPRDGGDTADLSNGEWILNPGSVGQPRDGDPRAAWMLLDTSAWVTSWRRVEYDIGGAQGAIREAGLPDSLAERLGYGQ